MISDMPHPTESTCSTTTGTSEKARWFSLLDPGFNMTSQFPDSRLARTMLPGTGKALMGTWRSGWLVLLLLEVYGGRNKAAARLLAQESEKTAEGW